MEQFKAGHKWADSCAEGDAFPIRKNAKGHIGKLDELSCLIATLSWLEHLIGIPQQHGRTGDSSILQL
jgi:hypothetical protein